MSTAHFVTVAVVLGSALCSAGCSGPPQEALATTEGAAAAALREAGAVDKLGETRWASKAPAGAAAPSFVVDASWPKPLPNDWRIGQVGGIAVDSHDNIWVYHRPRTLDASSAGAMPRTATNDQGVADKRARPSKALRRTQHGLLCPGAVRAQVRPRREPAHGMGRTLRSGLHRRELPRGGRLFLAGARARHLRRPQRLRVHLRQRRGRRVPSAAGVGDLSVGAVVRRRLAHTEVHGGRDVRLPDRHRRNGRAEQRENRRRAERHAATVPRGGHERRCQDEPPLRRRWLWQSTHPDRGCGDRTIRRSLRCLRAESRRRRSELGRGRHRRRPVDRRLPGRQHETLVLPQPDALRDREPRWLPLRLRPRQQPRADLRDRSGRFGQAVCERERRSRASAVSSARSTSPRRRRAARPALRRCPPIRSKAACTSATSPTARSTSSTARTSRSSTASAEPAAKPASSIGSMRWPSIRTATSTPAKWTRGSACRSS